MTDRLTATDRKAETEIELILKTMGRAVCMSDPEIDGRELSKLLLAYRTLQYQLQAKEVEIDSLTERLEKAKEALHLIARRASVSNHFDDGTTEKLSPVDIAQDTLSQL